MKFTTALVAAIATQAVSGFRAPADQPEGVYMAYYDDAGKEVHERIGDGLPAPDTLSSRSLTSPSRIFKRNQTWCGCNIRMTGGDCDAATHDIEAQLGGGKYIGAGLAYYSNRGGVTAFVCNHSRQQLHATGRDANYSWGAITRACGYYIAGTYEISGDLEAGYMLSGQNFCARDRGSSSHHC
ncbi:hypothetical protein PWT90_06846 [Aphanocladium album]|nr:hypothetical protein PWT90_06846 [Aphanocladium album]